MLGGAGGWHGLMAEHQEVALVLRPRGRGSKAQESKEQAEQLEHRSRSRTQVGAQV